MIGIELFAGKRRTVVREGKAVRRRVELRNNLHPHRLSIADEVAHLLLRVGTVDGRETRKEVAFHAEGCICLIPIVVELIKEATVVQV